MNKLTLPKGHLSYSQWQLWLSAKETYRKKYYPEQPPVYGRSPEMVFGNLVTEAMENKEPWTDFIPRFDKFEMDVEYYLDDVKVKGFIDNIDTTTFEFNEQKTGRTPWTQNKVQKHLQLDLYCVLLREMGKADHGKCNLVWVKTRKKVQKIPLITGEILEQETSQLELTGEYSVIQRIISKEEMDNCRASIINAAHEISEDYRAMKHLYN